MADPFINNVANEIGNYAGINGYFWTIYKQSSPARKEWNALPAVLIAPNNRTDVRFMAFGNKKNMRFGYDIFLVSDNNNLNTVNNEHDDFLIGMTNLFMPIPTSLYLSGGWQCRAMPDEQYDRTLFQKGLRVTCVQITIDSIIS